MGILDNKTRVLDTILTQEGRGQLADGSLRFSYVSFTDGAAFYKADAASGSADASARFYLEAASLPSDQISFKADDSGRLQPFSGHTQQALLDGQIVSFSTPGSTQLLVTGSSRLLSGDEFLEVASDMLSSSIDNFKNLYVIGTKDPLFEDDGFSVGPASATFTLTDDRPIQSKARRSVNVNSLDSLFNDPRLSRLPNFAYLPPLNRKRGTQPVKALGYYPPWGMKRRLEYADLVHELDYFERLGYVRRFTFDPTSRNNRLMAQFFEMHYNVIRKLDVIDFGMHTNAAGKQVHVFFAGRILVDENGAQTFVHQFTAVFE